MQKLLGNVCYYEFRPLTLGIIYKQEQVHTLEQDTMDMGILFLLVAEIIGGLYFTPPRNEEHDNTLS